MKTIRLGMIGAGKMAAWHLKSYARIPGVSIAAVANPSSEKGRKLAQKYGARHFRDGFELIDQSGLDAVDICVPSGLHKDYIIKALEKDLDVYTEKPLAGSLSDIEAVISANQKANRIIFNGFNYRFLAEFCAIKRLIVSGALGTVRYVKIFRVTKESPDSYILGEHSYGIFHEFHCHFIDLLFSFGFGNPSSVCASGTRVHSWRLDPDTATVSLVYPEGMAAEITVSFATPGLASEVLIIGTEATARLQYGRVSVVKRQDTWTLPTLVRLMFHEAFTVPHRVLRNPFSGSCQHFIQCVREGRHSECDERAALRVFRISYAATKSYAERQPISLSF